MSRSLETALAGDARRAMAAVDQRQLNAAVTAAKGIAGLGIVPGASTIRGLRAELPKIEPIAHKLPELKPVLEMAPTLSKGLGLKPALGIAGTLAKVPELKPALGIAPTLFEGLELKPALGIAGTLAKVPELKPALGIAPTLSKGLELKPALGIAGTLAKVPVLKTPSLVDSPHDAESPSVAESSFSDATAPTVRAVWVTAPVLSSEDSDAWGPRPDALDWGVLLRRVGTWARKGLATSFRVLLHGLAAWALDKVMRGLF